VYNSPSPSPCSADTANAAPNPSIQQSASSSRSASLLFASSSVGRLSEWTQRAWWRSSGVIPARASTTNKRTSALRAIACDWARARGSRVLLACWIAQKGISVLDENRREWRLSVLVAGFGTHCSPMIRPFKHLLRALGQPRSVAQRE
jgi:hypothetical protein